MAGHGPRLAAFVAAVRGDKSVQPYGNGNQGSLNFKKLDRWTAWLVDQSPYNEQRCVEILHEYKTHGHLTIKTANGYACEQGSPGMHGVYDDACPLAGLLRAKPSSDMFDACREYVLDAAALYREFEFRGSIYLPAPRVKDEERIVKGKVVRPMQPVDGYRDTLYAMLTGQQVKKKEDYWQSPQSIAVWLLREILANDRLTRDALAVIKSHPVPRLFMPLTRVDLTTGGFLAYADDSPVIRDNTIDVCNWLIVEPGIDALSHSRQPKARSGGVTLRAGYDWEKVPELEASREVRRQTYG